MDQLLTSIVNLFIGGTETTSTTLRWALVFMIENPDVQEKVFNEIISVVGPNREVLLDDKGTSLVIIEVIIINCLLQLICLTPKQPFWKFKEEGILQLWEEAQCIKQLALLI